MPAAIRFTFEFTESAFQVLRQRSLDKRTPENHAWNAANGPESGFWIELRDVSQRVIYRRVMDDPALRFEAPVNDSGDLRTKVDQAVRGRFSVAVPALPSARTLVIMASRPVDAKAVPIFNMPLTGGV